MNVYEVTLEPPREGYTLIQHVRALDEIEAMAKAAAAQRCKALRATLRRPCSLDEIAEEVAKTAPAPAPPPVTEEDMARAQFCQDTKALRSCALLRDMGSLPVDDAQLVDLQARVAAALEKYPHFRSLVK